MKRVDKIKITSDFTLLQSLKLMDEINCKLLIVMQDKKFLSVLSIGDIQRAIINKIELNSKISLILRKDVLISNTNDSLEKIKDSILEQRAEFMPVIDDNNNLVKVHFWADFFSHSNQDNIDKVNIPVIIMAGGKGTRLKPLTNILPKPLIPLGDKTILEDIISRFEKIGSNNFHVSLFYKSELIKYYFKEHNNNNNTNINFFEEDRPLGTAGSLSLLKGKLKDTFFVTNCDIIIDQDYRDIYHYHKENQNEITIVSALSHHQFPYGVIKTGNEGKLVSISEKPEMTFQINSGMYVLESHLLDEIPDNNFFHITMLFEKILKRNGKIGVFPVSEKSWIDIGDWQKYINEINVI